MINGLMDVNSMGDLVGRPVVLGDGSWAVVSGFTFDSTVCGFNQEGPSYFEVEEIHTIFAPIENTDLLSKLKDVHRNKTRASESLQAEVLESLKNLLSRGKLSKIISSLKKKPENWRKAPLSASAVFNDPSVDKIIVTTIWMGIKDSIKEKFEDYGRDLFSEAAAAFFANGGQEKVDEVTRLMGDEFEYLSSSGDPYDVLFDIKREQKKIETNEKRDEIREALRSEGGFSFLAKKVAEITNTEEAQGSVTDILGEAALRELEELHAANAKAEADKGIKPSFSFLKGSDK